MKIWHQQAGGGGVMVSWHALGSLLHFIQSVTQLKMRSMLSKECFQHLVESMPRGTESKLVSTVFLIKCSVQDMQTKTAEIGIKINKY